MKLQTTLAIIRQHRPCTSGWENLLRHLGPNYPQDKVIDFGTILESNGLDGALWGLRAVLPEQEKDRDRLARLFACARAESVLHIWEAKFPDDKRPREIIAVARRFALGQATQEELSAAGAAGAAALAAAGEVAGDAAWAAAWAAWAAAGAAGEVAWDAAWTAAWAAGAAGEVAGAAGEVAGVAFKDKFILYFCTDAKDGGIA